MCPLTISLKGNTTFINGLSFLLEVQYNTSSSSAFVPCVDPIMVIPLKKRYLKSIVESYPDVEPVETSVPPIFNNDTACGNTDFPMCSNTTSTPFLFVSFLTSLYQFSSLWLTTLSAPISKHLSIFSLFPAVAITLQL